MKVLKLSDVSKAPVSGGMFTGGVVTSQVVLTPEISRYFRISNINFGKGARNKFHSHTTDQVLVVTAGRGIVATEHEKVVVEVGDVIQFPAGEKHWHGATKDSEFSHLAITPTDSKITQLED